MIDVTKVKSQILYLLKKSNDKTEKNDENLTQAVETLVNGYYDLLMADTVKFSSEHSDTKTIYAMGYNWFSDMTRILQDMVGRKIDMDANDILYYLGRIKFIPQGWASSIYSIEATSFTSTVSVNPITVHKGVASSTFTMDNLDFESRAY